MAESPEQREQVGVSCTSTDGITAPDHNKPISKAGLFDLPFEIPAGDIQTRFPQGNSISSRKSGDEIRSAI